MQIDGKTHCSIVIVNYNTRDLLLSCIESICKNTNQKYKIDVYVVDNASSDHSIEAVREEYPEAILLPQKHNLGYAKANNLVLSNIQSEYVLLLNPDTKLLDNCLKILLDYMEENQDVGAIGAKVLLPQGILDKACKRGFPTPANSFWYLTGFSKLFPKVRMFGGYHLTYLRENDINEVDSLVGAFMLIRSTVLHEVGILDEDFFMYGEDIDLCYRIKKAGWKVIFNPQAEVIHYKGAASRIGIDNSNKTNNACKKKSYKVIYEFHRSMVVFYQKHYRDVYNIFIRGLVYSGIGIRFILELGKNVLRK